MFFNTLTRSHRRMSRRAPAFSLEVFRVADHPTQQIALMALRRFHRRGVRASGTHRQTETFLVVDCRTKADSARVRHLVLGLDPFATITFSSGEHEHVGVAS